MKRIIYSLLGLMFATSISCTQDFEEINQDKKGLPAANFPSETYLPSMMRWLYPDNGAGYGNFIPQLTQNLNADIFAGYFGSASGFSGNINNSTYALHEGWNGQMFQTWSSAMSLYLQVKAVEKNKPTDKNKAILAMATVVKVLHSSISADYYGTLPYTTFGTQQAAYDPLQKVYEAFFADLDNAASMLDKSKTSTEGISDDADLFYGGDQSKWLKFINSLRLRLAMRIVNANESMAKEQALKAINDENGLIFDNNENARFHSMVYNNSLWILVYSYTDTNISADMVCYLTGFEDPRLPVYASKSQDGNRYVGVRLGSLFSSKSWTSYSTLGSYAPGRLSNPTWSSSPLTFFNAAESNFLLSEAALRGWTAAKTAKEYYNDGVTKSMEQWGVSMGDYLNSAKTQSNFVDPLESSRNINAVSAVAPMYNPNATKEAQLEQIITQKWIATWPGCSPNAWSEYRRTGYPKLFPADHLAPGVTVQKTMTWNGGQMVNSARKLRIPQNEYNNNHEEVAKAVSAFFGGKDAIDTHVWWDVDKANF